MSDQNPQYPSYPSGGEATQPPADGAPTPPPAYGGQPAGPVVPYASWGSRVGAILLDGLIGIAIAIVPIIIGVVIAFKDAGTEITQDPVTGLDTVEITGGVNAVGVIILVLASLFYFGFTIWNLAIRQGKLGQSLGKKVLGISVVRQDNGRFLGAGAGFLRWLVAQVLGGICFLDYLWPLWDEKKQTWHDKVVSSVVIRVK